MVGNTRVIWAHLERYDVIQFNDQLEKLQTSNPQQFWRDINKLGPNKNKLIPMEILVENGVNLFFKTDHIFKKWETDYSSLYVCSGPSQLNGEFLNEMCELKCDLIQLTVKTIC